MGKKLEQTSPEAVCSLMPGIKWTVSAASRDRLCFSRPPALSGSGNSGI